MFVSCGEKSKELPDISNSTVELKYYNFYKDFPGENPTVSPDTVLALFKKYPVFFNLFNRYVIAIGGPENKDFTVLTQAFCSDHMIRDLYNQCIDVHGDLAGLKMQMNTAFKYYHEYFPTHPVPEVYFYISGLNQSVVIDSQLLAIGIDKFLGSNNKYYQQLGLPQYQRKRMIPEMMTVDAMMAWAESEFPASDSSDNILNSMIYYGKLQYMLEYVLPEMSDSVLFSFSSQQWDWCEKNEKKMWTWFIENKMLFESNPMEIRRFTADGPFTTQFSKDSPARTGVWLGWRIIHKYMSKNSKITLQELMENEDGQKILRDSGYNP
ncbi:MAG: hypothetical protein CVU05_15810 [Bacteroidetes bacterium HGW-Bacteroidetes-21]|nr:MAG: hypothetical protein CVU05_15810 [Bacteroidetes bacterium HGW-Bacteroidetes-21]